MHTDGIANGSKVMPLLNISFQHPWELKGISSPMGLCLKVVHKTELCSL